MRPSPKSTIKRSGLRTALRVVGWIIATLALLIALAAAWAWSNRYELIERQAITYLDSLGIKADLTIKSANGQRADIRNVSLAYDDTPFLTVKRLQATYQWRDLLNGKVERLDFTGLDAVITVNENGQIIDGWRPPSTGNGAGFPARGIGVKDGTILLKTPYGDMPITAEANIAAVDRFDLTGTLQPFTLTRDAMSVSADGPVTVSRKGGPYIAALPSTRLSLTHPAASLSQTRLAMSGTFQPGTNEAIGQARLLGGKFDMEGGALTESVRRRPYQVVLFDEIEKAHPDVFNVLLQVLDDGRLTDGQGRTVNFQNTLIIMTSNIGAQHLLNLGDGETVQGAKVGVMADVSAHFRPEFLNRIDEILLFERLKPQHMGAIVDIQMNRLQGWLRDKQIVIEMTDAARDHLGQAGYDPSYGARPLKRVIQKQVQDELARELLAGRVHDGDTIKIDAAGGKVRVSVIGSAAKTAD